MKRLLLKVKSLLMIFTLAGATTALADVGPKPFVVPELKAWTEAAGTFTPSGRIVTSGNKELKKLAAALAEDFRLLTQETYTAVQGKAQAGDIELRLVKNKKLGTEGYALEIGDKTVISAANMRGLYWGTRTVLQMYEQAEKAATASARRALPKGSTIDTPEYGFRGFSIDCARKFIPMDYLRSLVKMMGYYKMNVLSVHLNDNGFRQYFGDDWNKTQAAFRLECETYPGLTAKDGSYTKKEFIELQKLAEENGVEIIPEIDVPAHSLAFTHYKPEIGSKEYGMDHLDLFNPETYKFLDGLFKEYLSGPNPVFRGKRVHIGTDEYSNAKEEVREKFREFTDYYIKYVESFGKEAVVWGALSHAYGKTPVKSKDVTMYCWYNGYANPKEMKEQGYKLVSIPDGAVYIVPAAGYYYDYLNCQYLYEHWTPASIGNQKFEENDPAILGGMFAVWNDHCGNGISTKDVHDRVFPALQTLAVKCWTGKETKLPYADYAKQVKNLSEAPGVNEAGKLSKDGSPVTINIPELKPGMENHQEEVGYGYTVSFDIEGAAEEKGTELLRSKNAVFYLADPREGKLGFARDGYLNTFNYRIPKGEKVSISIQGNNKMTRLLVNGKVKEELGPKTIYVVKPGDRTKFQFEEGTTWETDMYIPSNQMYYQRTLVFPLRKAGNFKSKITNVEIKNEIK